MIFNNPNIIFLHIPKTGGNYFTNLFINYSEEEKYIQDNNIQDGKHRFTLRSNITNKKHVTLGEYEKKININDYDIYFIYRDPLERLLSGYFSPNRVLLKFKSSEVENFKFDLSLFKNFIRKEQSTTDFLYHNISNYRLKLYKFFNIKYSIKIENIQIKYFDFNHLNEDINSFKIKYNFDLSNQNLNEKINTSFHKSEISNLSKNKDLRDLVMNSHHFLDYQLKDKVKKI